jgi:hypothetical protein
MNEIPVQVVAETIVQGKTVAEWAAHVEALTESAEAARVDRTKLLLIDLTDTLPPGVQAALDAWRRAGKPTEFTDTRSRIERERAEGEKHAALANLELSKAKDAEECGTKKKVEQHTRYAARERAKADKHFAEAERLLAEWKKEHP